MAQIFEISPGRSLQLIDLPGGGKGVPVLDFIMALKYKQRQLELKEEPGLDKARLQARQCLYKLKKYNPDYESFKSLETAKRGGYNCEVLTKIEHVDLLVNNAQAFGQASE